MKSGDGVCLGPRGQGATTYRTPGAFALVGVTTILRRLFGVRPNRERVAAGNGHNSCRAGTRLSCGSPAIRVVTPPTPACRSCNFVFRPVDVLAAEGEQPLPVLKLGRPPGSPANTVDILFARARVSSWAHLLLESVRPGRHLGCRRCPVVIDQDGASIRHAMAVLGCGSHQRISVPPSFEVDSSGIKIDHRLQLDYCTRSSGCGISSRQQAGRPPPRAVRHLARKLPQVFSRLDRDVGCRSYVVSRPRTG